MTKTQTFEKWEGLFLYQFQLFIIFKNLLTLKEVIYFSDFPPSQNLHDVIL